MFITGRKPLFHLQQDEVAGAGQAPTEETPENTATEAAEQQHEIDWAKRYSDLQPEYTRTSQEAARLRERDQQFQQLLTSEDPDIRRQAAEALGYSIDDDTNDTQQYDDDPLEQLRQEINALKGDLSQRSQQEQQQARLAEIEIATENALNSLGVPEDDGVRDWIVSRAVALPPTPEGLPDVQAAHREFDALMNAQQKSWAKSKRAPHISAVGQAGTNTPDLDSMTRSQRDEWMAERVRALNDQ